MAARGELQCAQAVLGRREEGGGKKRGRGRKGWNNQTWSWEETCTCVIPGSSAGRWRLEMTQGPILPLMGSLLFTPLGMLGVALGLEGHIDMELWLLMV